MSIKERQPGRVTAAAEIAERYAEARGADRKKAGGSIIGSGVDSRSTVGDSGVKSSGSNKNMVCFYRQKEGTGRWSAVNGWQTGNRR